MTDIGAWIFYDVYLVTLPQMVLLLYKSQCIVHTIT